MSHRFRCCCFFGGRSAVAPRPSRQFQLALDLPTGNRVHLNVNGRTTVGKLVGQAADILGVRHLDAYVLIDGRVAPGGRAVGAAGAVDGRRGLAGPVARRLRGRQHLLLAQLLACATHPHTPRCGARGHRAARSGWGAGEVVRTVEGGLGVWGIRFPSGERACATSS